LVGAVLLVVSPFLVWGQVDIVVGTISQTGMDTGYGWITLVVGLAVAGLAAAWFGGANPRLVRVGLLLLALGAGGLTAYELSRARDCALFVDAIDECVGTPTYGPGLFVALAGTVVTLVAAALAWRGRPTR
jgi:hypothetical protein